MTILDHWRAVIDRRNRHADLFGAMMQCFGAYSADRSFGFSDAMTLEKAARRCLRCPTEARCVAWFETSRDRAEAERFCPNAAVLSELGAAPARRIN